MTGSSQEYVYYRLKKAWSTFHDAQVLADVQSWNSSINRLYYACFYGILSLFAKHGINSHTHSGVKTQFLLHFIKTEKLNKSYGILYSDLFDFRQKGDYGDFFDFDEQMVKTLIPRVESFLQEIENLIQTI